MTLMTLPVTVLPVPTLVSCSSPFHLLLSVIFLHISSKKRHRPVSYVANAGWGLRVNAEVHTGSGALCSASELSRERRGRRARNPRGRPGSQDGGLATAGAFTPPPHLGASVGGRILPCGKQWGVSTILNDIEHPGRSAAPESPAEPRRQEAHLLVNLRPLLFLDV